jgi:hypothetical protein
LPLPAQAPAPPGAGQTAGDQQQEREDEAQPGGDRHQPADTSLQRVAQHVELGVLWIACDDDAQTDDHRGDEDADKEDSQSTHVAASCAVCYVKQAIESDVGQSSR